MFVTDGLLVTMGMMVFETDGLMVGRMSILRSVLTVVEKLCISTEFLIVSEEKSIIKLGASTLTFQRLILRLFPVPCSLFMPA